MSETRKSSLFFEIILAVDQMLYPVELDLMLYNAKTDTLLYVEAGHCWQRRPNGILSRLLPYFIQG
jgi:hypothetical protein